MSDYELTPEDRARMEKRRSEMTPEQVKTMEEKWAKLVAFEAELLALVRKHGVTLTADDGRVGYHSDFACHYLSRDSYWPEERTVDENPRIYFDQVDADMDDGRGWNVVWRGDATAYRFVDEAEARLFAAKGAGPVHRGVSP